ncbi:MAG TPA: conjugative transposon protein TraN [Pedobacter sp.]|jgi:conjugative transposon TraN protein
MKKISAVVITGIFLLCINTINVFAQIKIGKTETTIITPQYVSIGFSKTTNLIFPYPIKSIDRGSQDILVQKAIGVENILQVKAGKPNFKETNLTIVTSDGSLYSYLLSYTERPVSLNIRVSNTNASPEPLAVFTKDATTGEIERTAEIVSEKKRINKGIADSKHDVMMAVKGIYVHNDVLYFQIALQNTSGINYDVNMLRFFIRDQKKSKRTASQELEIQPAYKYGNTDVIRANSEQVIVVALPKFTIPDKKYMVVQLMEKNDGRHLEFKVGNRTIIRAKAL